MTPSAANHHHQQTGSHVAQHLTRAKRLDFHFLLPIGIVQLTSATLRLVISALAGVSTSQPTATIRLKLLSTVASFLLYTITGASIVLASRAGQLRQLRYRSTCCLVLCSLSAVFTVLEIDRQLSQLGGALMLLEGDAEAAVARRRAIQQRAVLTGLLLLQCVILAFSGCLCVRLIWTKGQEPVPDEAADADAAVTASVAAASSAEAGDSVKMFNMTKL